MAAKEISSLQHPLVKQAFRLRTEKKAREKERLVLVSGKKMISDLATFYPIYTLFFTKTPPSRLRAREVLRVSPELLKKISGLEEKDGYAAIVPMPEPQALMEKTHILILDQVSDPGNLGTLWRSALALGWGGVWLTPGTVDPFNDKALRAAKGTTFRLPYEKADPAKIAEWLQKQGGSLFTADLEGEPLSTCSIQSPLALLLGNEGKGPSDWSSSLARKVTIPMQNEVESLNVSSAGSILLYTMRPTL